MSFWVKNSLSNKLEEFKITQTPISIYMCGPTVYDDSHLGHARTYISFDIILRIMEEYLNLNVNSVMNITDIDDKIINKTIEEIYYKNYKKLILEGNISQEELSSKLKFYYQEMEKYVNSQIQSKIENLKTIQNKIEILKK